MHFPRTLAIMASLVFFTSGANAQNEEIPTLGGSEAIQAIIGSTIIFVDGPDHPKMIFVGSDHMFDGFSNGERSSGKWFEKDHLFCIEHESPCMIVTITGTEGFLQADGSGDSHMFRIEAGDRVGIFTTKDY